MEFRHTMPRNNLIFGKGVLAQIGEEAKKIGTTALIVTGKTSMKKLGFLDKVRKTLENSGVNTLHYGGAVPNPTTNVIDEGAAREDLRHKYDLVIGLGGGSSIDTAKAIAILAGHPETESIWNFTSLSEKPRSITAKTLPIIAINSTSGTGSHVNHYFVLTNPATSEKPGVASEYIFPRASFVDIEILSKMPPELTAMTGFDALTHALEGLVSRQSNPISELYGLRAVELIFQYLPVAYKEPDNQKARECVALADTYAGWSDQLVGCVVPHALGHAVGGHYPEVAHGEVLAAVTPAVMRFNIENGNELIWKKYCLAAQRMERAISSPYTKKKAVASVEMIEELLQNIELDISLKQLGVLEEMLSELARNAIRTVGECVDLNPVKADYEDLINLLKKSM